MESFERNKRVIRNFVIIIIIAGLAVGAYFAYNYHMEKSNTEKFINYLMTQGYKKEKGGLYAKENNDITFYLAKNDTMISKIFIIDNGETTYNYSIFPNKDTYELNLKFKGSYDGVYGLSEQKMIYDKKNKNYECKIISNQNLPPFCNEMKKEMDDYIKEVKKIIKDSGTNEKYILNK